LSLDVSPSLPEISGVAATPRPSGSPVAPKWLSSGSANTQHHLELLAVSRELNAKASLGLLYTILSELLNVYTKVLIFQRSGNLKKINKYE